MSGAQMHECIIALYDWGGELTGMIVPLQDAVRLQEQPPPKRR